MRVANPSQRKKKTGDSTRSSGPNRGAEGKKARVFGCRQIFFMDRIRFDQLKSIYKLLLSRFGPQGWWPGRTRTEIIIGAILTQNTNWQNVEKAILNLKKARLLNFSALDQGSERAVAGLIRPAGYFNVKARRLKNFVKFFIEDMNSSWKALRVMPFDELRQKLLAVNGVGPENSGLHSFICSGPSDLCRGRLYQTDFQPVWADRRVGGLWADTAALYGSSSSGCKTIQ